MPSSVMCLARFQFTQPKRAATRITVKQYGDCAFQFTQPKRAATRHHLQYTSGVSFNSRSPSGLRRSRDIGYRLALAFQFTQPKRAATVDSHLFVFFLVFQFTQPKRAATCCSRCEARSSLGFQFTQPKRAATCCWCRRTRRRGVSIHAAQAGCDLNSRTLPR